MSSAGIVFAYSGIVSCAAKLAKLCPLSVIALLVAACGAEEGHTPRLRKVPPSPSMDREETDPEETKPSTPDDGTPIRTEVYLSDLDIQVVANGYGPLERDMSNGEQEPNDGKPISLGGVQYSKGLGVHAASEVIVALGGNYATFLSDIGVDDEVGDKGSVVFRVIVDGATRFDSGTMTGTSETKKIELDVSGKQELKLVVTGGDDNVSDHADWAGARLVK